MKLDTFYFANSPISNQIARGEYSYDDNEINYVRVMKDNNNYIYTTFTLSKKIGYKDLVITDAIYSIKNSGNSYFNIQMILQALSGKDNLRRSVDEEIEDIRTRIEKLNSTEISISCKDEFKIKKKGSKFNGHYSGKFLDFKIDYDRNYEDIKLPLYDYNQENHQMIAIPMELMSLCGEKTVNNSFDNLSVKHYLIRRLALSSYKPDDNKAHLSFMKTIVYARDSHRKGRKKVGMLYDLELENKSTNPIIKMHRIVKEYLKVLKKIGFIKSFLPLRNDDRSIKGVQVIGSVEAYKIYKNIHDTEPQKVIDVIEKTKENVFTAEKALAKSDNDVEKAIKLLKQPEITVEHILSLRKKLGKNLPEDLKDKEENELISEINKRMKTVLTETSPVDMDLVIKMLVYTCLDPDKAIVNIRYMKDNNQSFTRLKKIKAFDPFKVFIIEAYRARRGGKSPISSVYQLLEEEFVVSGDYEKLPGDEQTLKTYVQYLEESGQIDSGDDHHRSSPQPKRAKKPRSRTHKKSQ